MVDDARQAEVEHLHVAVAAHHDVLGLDVAMDDAGGVRRGQRPRHLPADVHGRRQRLRRLDERPQRPSVDELLDDEELAVGVSPTSWMVTMLGWLRAEAARASRRKRWTRSLWSLSRVRISLMATGRFSRVSNAAVHLAHAAAADAFVDAVVPERGRSHAVRGGGAAPAMHYIST